MKRPNGRSKVMEENRTEIKDYSQEKFSSLPNFKQACQNLQKVKIRLNTFGKVIGKHGLKDDVGLALLHRHFDLTRDEILVEQIFPSNFEAISSVRQFQHSKRIIPHLFRAVFNRKTDTFY